MLDIFNFVTHLINFMPCVFSFMCRVNFKSCAINSSCMYYVYAMCFKLQSAHIVQHVYFICSMCALNCFVQIINFVYLN